MNLAANKFADENNTVEVVFAWRAMAGHALFVVGVDRWSGTARVVGSVNESLALMVPVAVAAAAAGDVYRWCVAGNDSAALVNSDACQRTKLALSLPLFKLLHHRWRVIIRATDFCVRLVVSYSLHCEDDCSVSVSECVPE